MIPWETLDSAAVPDGGTLRLKRRGAEYSIMLGSNELMNSRMGDSEKALAHLCCAHLHGRREVRMLIGGLGMGFTLRAALHDLADDAGIVVAEIVPAVVSWARGPMADLFAGSLDDPRVGIHEGDVADRVAGPPQSWDAILLDVDNGPDGLSRAANDRLYDAQGLRKARAALRPRGVLAVWSSEPDRAFTRRLERAGFSVEEHRVRAQGRSGARHVIWLAVAPA